MPAKPVLFLLGCCHEVQLKVPPVHFRNDAKVYLATLNACASEVTFIGEEAGWIADSMASAIARKRKVVYHNIDIPEDVRKRIYHLVQGEQMVDDYLGKVVEDESYLGYRKAWGLVREYHMHKSFLELAGSHSQAILICGLGHLDGFKRLFDSSHEIRDITPIYDECSRKLPRGAS
jgi:hypothetical protein